MVVLVTGGCGFIGANYIQYLLSVLSSDSCVVNVDALTYAGNVQNLVNVESDSRYVFEHADITNTEALARVFSKYPVDEVVHFAAESHVDRSIECGDVFVKTNVLGTSELLRVAMEAGVKRFVHVSTDEVYGTLGLNDPAFTEQSPIDPSSPYSASKAASDMLALSYFKTHGFPVMVTRCSNNYGPYQFPEKLIPLMISRALKNESLPVYGDGSNVRDWIYVQDHCVGVDQVRLKGVPGEVYNLGGESERGNLTVVQALLRLLDKPDSLIQFVPDRLGHDFRYAIDFGKAQTELDWTPQVSFEEGLERTVAWYQSHSDWLAAIADGSYRKMGHKNRFGG